MRSKSSPLMFPLSGIKIVEFEGIGPGPLAGFMLMQMGADVTVVGRPGASALPDELTPKDGALLSRGKRRVTLNLKNDEDKARALDMVAQSDGLIEGNRPGVMERLGLGPDVCGEYNPRLVYGRMTGWGQTGPLSHAAGQDINYISISGALHAVGPANQKPSIPLNYVGDFGGGAMLLAVGVLSALHESRRTGRGQVVDAAMTDGAALLSAMMYGFKAEGSWNNERGENLLDGGAHFYDTYACADGKFIAIGPIEPQFYAEFRRIVGLADDPDFDHQTDRRWWPRL